MFCRAWWPRRTWVCSTCVPFVAAPLATVVRNGGSSNQCVNNVGGNVCSLYICEKGWIIEAVGANPPDGLPTARRRRRRGARDTCAAHSHMDDMEWLESEAL